MEILPVCFVVTLLVGMAAAGLNHVPAGQDIAQAGSEHGFRYAVNDYNGNEHSHQQQKVGDTTTGEYKVLLPDGRLQTVTYIADAGGYRAKVSYTPASPGEATTAGAGVPGAGIAPVHVPQPIVAPARGALPIRPTVPVNPVHPYNSVHVDRNVPTAFGPSSGSIYPGHPLYRPELAYQGVSSYGPQLTYQPGYVPFAYNQLGYRNQDTYNPFYRALVVGKK